MIIPIIVSFFFLSFSSRFDLQCNRMIPNYLLLGWTFITIWMYFKIILAESFLFTPSYFILPVVVTIIGIVLLITKRMGSADAWILSLLSFSFPQYCLFYLLIYCFTIVGYFTMLKRKIKKQNIKPESMKDFHFPIIPLFMIAYIIFLVFLFFTPQIVKLFIVI